MNGAFIYGECMSDISDQMFSVLAHFRLQGASNQFPDQVGHANQTYFGGDGERTYRFTPTNQHKGIQES